MNIDNLNSVKSFFFAYFSCLYYIINVNSDKLVILFSHSLCLIMNSELN